VRALLRRFESSLWLQLFLKCSILTGGGPGAFESFAGEFLCRADAEFAGNDVNSFGTNGN
jgi:hypothetical protein